jgi:hypoxia up-regulated 1
VKNRITDDEDSLKAVSTDEQRAEVLTLGSDTEEWLYDDGRNADVHAFKAKHAAFRKKAEAIFNRFSELSARPAAVKKALEMLADVKSKVDGWGEKMPHVTEEEKAGLLEVVAKAEKWVEEKEAAQGVVAGWEEPAYESADVPLQVSIKVVQSDFM